jgi:hypothetical protein
MQSSPDSNLLAFQFQSNTVRVQFEAARTVKPGKPSFRLAFNSED